MAEQVTKKRRLQSGAACENCRKRKSRCDAARPTCSNCQIRMIPCHYGTTQPGQDVSSGTKQGREHDTGKPRSPTQSKDTSPTVVSSFASADQDGSSSILAAHESHAPQTYFGGSSTFTFLPDAASEGFTRGLPPDRQGHATLVLRNSTDNESRGGITTSLESCFNLPDRMFADSLVDAYFNRMHGLYPFLHEGTFRKEYETMWDQPSQERNHVRLSWFGVLNMVFAHGCEFCGAISQHEALAVAVPFVERSRSIILSHVFKAGTLETVQSLLLMCYYLQGTLELDECWNLVGLMIRTALSLGLHLDPCAERFLPIERELRRRAWWGCFVIDRTLSMKFGRPLTLRIEEGNVELPLEVDDQYITNDCHKARQPIGTPSFTSFFVNTIKLSHIVYNMLTTLYLRGLETNGSNIDTKLQVPSSRYNQILSNVILLDGQLQSWWENAPQHLTRQPTEGERGWVNFQSQRTVSRIRSRIEDDFCRSVAISSARICIDSARETITLINTSYHRQQLNALSYNAQYVFTSMCILCILERMDSSKRVLLKEDVCNANGEDCHSVGLNFLQAASLSSLLAARYVNILQQLHGEHAIGRLLDSAKDNNVSTTFAHFAQNHDSLIPAFSPGNIGRWSFNPGGAVSQTELDFADIDDLFFGTGLVDENTMEPANNQVPAAYMSW